MPGKFRSRTATTLWTTPTSFISWTKTATSSRRPTSSKRPRRRPDSCAVICDDARPSLRDPSERIKRAQQDAGAQPEEPSLEHFARPPAAENLRQPGIHRQTERPVAARQGDCVLLDRQVLGQHHKSFGMLHLGASQQKLVAGEAFDFSCFEGSDAFIPILYRDEDYVELVYANLLAHDALIGRAGNHSDLLPGHFGE